MAEKTLASVAQEALEWFTLGKRDNGEEFWCVKDGAPKWISDHSEPAGTLVFAAHEGMFPDDWRYEFIVGALSLVAGGDEDGDGIEADVYTVDLCKWLASHSYRVAYCDEAVKELGGEEYDTIARIQIGQVAEKREVFHAVKTYLEELIENDDDDDESE